jgi:cytochrome c biogenesis protein CcmG, thiol:disulfide interchange protein DsbE
MWLTLVTGYFIYLFMLALPACARDLTAQEVLEKVALTYGSLKAVHVVAEKEETTYSAGRAQTAVSEYELATATGGRYLARWKQPQQEMRTVSDGSTIWLALSSRKQWSRVSAAPQADDNDEEHDARAASAELHDSLENTMLHRFLALAKTAQHPVVVKRRDFELGGEKVPCYAIRTHAGGSDIELLVDQQRFVVLEYTEKSGPPDTQTAIAMKIELVELNQEVADSLFRFEPEPGWSEVGTLPPAAEPIRIGERAADFTVRTLDGESVALESLRGSVVALDFWATWCVPCRMEFPTIDKLRSEFGGVVRFYGISDESLATVKKFVEENRSQMTMLLDSNREIRRRYGIHKIPVLLVIDREGVVRRQFIGVQTESELREAIRSVVDPSAHQ